MEPNVSEKITSKWKVTPCEANVPHLLYHTLQKTKVNFEKKKASKTTIVIRFDLKNQ